MSGEFLEPGIFAYLFDETGERKRNMAERLIRTALQTRGACISLCAQEGRAFAQLLHVT